MGIKIGNYSEWSAVSDTSEKQTKLTGTSTTEQRSLHEELILPNEQINSFLKSDIQRIQWRPKAHVKYQLIGSKEYTLGHDKTDNKINRSQLFSYKYSHYISKLNPKYTLELHNQTKILILHIKYFLMLNSS